jgi:hypothetical protein
MTKVSWRGLVRFYLKKEGPTIETALLEENGSSEKGDEIEDENALDVKTSTSTLNFPWWDKRSCRPMLDGARSPTG